MEDLFNRDSERSAASAATPIFCFSVGRFFLLAAIIGCVLAIRFPDAFLFPYFAEEDGSIFFEDAFELPLTSHLFTPYNGY